MTETSEAQIIMYGTDWCPESHLAKFVLKKLKADYTYINIDQDKAAENIVIQNNAGSRSVPTIFFPDDSVLVEPSRRELTKKVLSLGLSKK
ncbi:MAG: glutaredoxin domain-containing protein [Chloroflexota bacterium]